MPLGTETEEKLFEILRNGELQQFNTIDFSEISDSQLSKLHSQLSLSLSNQREADCRIIQLLMQCHLLNHVKFFLSNYIDKYDDTDDRIKRAVVQYFDLIGQVYIIHRIVKRKTYQNSSDSVVSYFSSISRENNDIDELFGDELVLIIRKTNTERKRARERVRTEYKNTWRTEIRRLKRFSSTDFNSQALLHLKNLSLWDRFGLLNDPAVGDVMQRAYSDAGLPFQGNQTMLRLSAFDETYFPTSRHDVIMPAKELAETGKIDTIVELGSGAGTNLFKIFHSLNHDVRYEIDFFGLELTDEGRTAANLIHKSQPDMKFFGAEFDFYDPTFDMIPDLKSRNVLFFTNHAIEQIPILSSDFFNRLIDVSPICYGVHNEPIGWQTLPELVQARETENHVFFDRIRKTMKNSFSRSNNIELNETLFGYSTHPVSYNSAWWSYHKSYNKNLLEILRQNERNGNIKIHKFIKNHEASNPINASTYVEWNKI